jgi:MFS transporter, PPP family, 3-phenylpropionic acid transporter
MRTRDRPQEIHKLAEVGAHGRGRRADLAPLNEHLAVQRDARRAVGPGRRDVSHAPFPRLYLHLFASAACMLPAASYILTTFHWRPSDIGIGTACAAFAGVIASPLWGWLDDRTGWAPRVAVLASAAAALATALSLGRLPHEFTWGAMALFGAAAGPLDSLLTTRILESGMHGHRLGRLRAFGSLGWVLGLAVAASVLAMWPEHAQLVPVIAAVVAVTAPRYWGIRKTPSPKAAARRRRRGRAVRLPQMPWRAALSVLVFTFPASFVLSALVQFTAGWAHRDLAAGPFLALAPIALAAALELPIFPWVDRLAHRFTPLTLVVLASPPLALATLSVALVPSSLVMLGVQPLVAASVALWVVGQSRMLLAAASPSERASAQTLGSALASGGAGLLAGEVGGHIADAVGYRGLFLTLAAVALVGALTGLVGILRQASPAHADNSIHERSQHVA